MTKTEYKNRKYSVEPYNPEWKKQFETEVEFLSPIFSDKAISIEHIGSTAVPGLAGKPTIDILITVEKIEIADELSEKIESIGYKSLGDYINQGSHLFVKEVDNTRLVNLHVFEVEHPHVKDMINLRNYFRSHPEVVEEYCKLKFELVEKYPDDYGLYRKYKDEWMENLKKNISEPTALEQKFINWAKERLDESTTITKEELGDQSEVFKLHAESGDYFLKIGVGLEKERERLEWLNGKLPVPKVIGFTKIDDKGALLLSAIEGKNLAVLSKEWLAEKVIVKLAEALQQFHAVDAKNCPFGNYETGKVLVHGDACLPNFIFQGDNFSGYIDLGDLMVASPEVDFSAAIWSLQYNLGVGHGRMFLEKYGVKNASEELVEKLRLKYEDMQEKWGL